MFFEQMPKSMQFAHFFTDTLKSIPGMHREKHVATSRGLFAPPADPGLELLQLSCAWLGPGRQAPKSPGRRQLKMPACYTHSIWVAEDQFISDFRTSKIHLKN